MTEHEYLTRPETADLCRTTSATLAAWAYRREGPPFALVGKRALYRRADVLAWIASRTVGRP